MSLSSLIVQREVATIRQVEEALARQVIYGGDLVTNLLEVARIEEHVMTALLAESMSLPPSTPGELALPTEQVRTLVPGDMAAQRAIVPLALEDGRLVLAVAEPLPVEVEEELSFALGMRLVQRVAPMVRVRQALMKIYGHPLERRMQRLLARIAGDVVGTGSTPPLFAQPPQVAEPPRPPSSPPLRMSPTGGTPSQSFPSRRATNAGFPRPTQPPRNEQTNALAPPPPTATPIPPPPPHGPPAHESPAAARQSAPAWRASSSPPSARPALIARQAGQTRPIRRRRGPLTAEIATQEAEEAPDRDALLDLFFEFARQYFDYSALFLLHGDIAEGRDAFGTGASRERVVGIGVPLDLPSILSLARDRKRAVTAKPSADGLDAVLLADLGRTTRGPVVVVPVVVRTRSVALLLGDFGEGGVDGASISDVASFAGTVGVAFERLIVRKKLQGFVAGNAAGQVGRIDPALVSPKPLPPPGAVAPSHSTAYAARLAPKIEANTPAEGSRIEPHSPRAMSVAMAPARVPREHSSALDGARAEHPPSSDVTAVSARSPGTSQAFSPPTSVPIVVAVRRPTGPPIPREEPDWSQGSPRIEHAAPLPRGEESREPPSSTPEIDIDAAPIDEALALELLEELSRDVPLDVTYDGPSQGNLAHRESAGRAQHAEDSVYQSAPSSEPAPQSMAIPARRPPSSRAMPAASLPSVIVDMDQELGALADRLMANPRDEAAESELLRQGQQAMPAIMARFPGPILVDRERLGEAAPRASDCGPILRLVAGQRKVALPFVVDKLADPDPERRYWATFLLAELHYSEAVPTLMLRLFDDEARTRRVARLAAAAIAKRSPQVVVDELERLSGVGTSEQRALALETLSDLREPIAVPILIRLLAEARSSGASGRSDGASDPAGMALGALRGLLLVTRQDFGGDVRKWEAWWSVNAGRHRIEWLIDALDHEVSDIRRAAGEELKSLTKEYFGFSELLPSRERQRTQQRYRDWWITEGRARFRRR